jgi:hypothetical protein
MVPEGERFRTGEGPRIPLMALMKKRVLRKVRSASDGPSEAATEGMGGSCGVRDLRRELNHE